LVMNRAAVGRGIPIAAVAAALVLFAAWTLATWVLEGRIDTLRRPEVVAARVVYAIIANLLIGIAVAASVLRFFIRQEWIAKESAGFGRCTPSPVWFAIALVLGLAFYAVQEAPSLDPVVLTNAFAQVLVVSVAEVVVCWAVVGATAEAFLRPCGRTVSVIGGTVVASMLFGGYHFAHSAPFNTPEMVALLSIVGLATSAFFFISRDVYATIIFHNFFGVFGVLQALAASGDLAAISAIQPSLLVIAFTAVTVLALSDRLLLRKLAKGEAASTS
jgi:hypothetical protein